MAETLKDGLFEESEPVRPEDARPSRDGRRKKSALSDPVVVVLLLVIMSIVIVFLVGLVSAIMTGVLMPAAPRTEVERTIKVYEAEIASGKMTPQYWSDYILTLVQAKQYSKADQVAVQALAGRKRNTAVIWTARANLEIARGQYDLAVKYADKAMAEAKKERQGEVDAARTKANADITGEGESMGYIQALLLKANALELSGADAKAIGIYDEYLSENPMDADIHTRLGVLKADAGDKAGARKEFETALQFVPDHPDALEGLKKIGGTSK